MPLASDAVVERPPSHDPYGDPPRDGSWQWWKQAVSDLPGHKKSRHWHPRQPASVPDSAFKDSYIDIKEGRRADAARRLEKSSADMPFRCVSTGASPPPGASPPLPPRAAGVGGSSSGGGGGGSGKLAADKATTKTVAANRSSSSTHHNAHHHEAGPASSTRRGAHHLHPDEAAGPGADRSVEAHRLARLAAEEVNDCTDSFILRRRGRALHKAGDHTAAVVFLTRAKNLCLDRGEARDEALTCIVLGLSLKNIAGAGACATKIGHLPRPGSAAVAHGGGWDNSAAAAAAGAEKALQRAIKLTDGPDSAVNDKEISDTAKRHLGFLRGDGAMPRVMAAVIASDGTVSEARVPRLLPATMPVR